jgi:hypothetical protein
VNKKILFVGGGGLAIAVFGFFALQFFLGAVVRTGVNAIGPKITQTKVELAGASISPLTGRGTLTGLYVGNPKGWSSDKAFYLGKIHVSLKPISVLGDHIIVDEIIIDAPQFVYETKIVASNINDLLKNIEAATGTKDAGAQPVTKSGKPIKFEVRHFKMTNGKVTLGVGAAAIPLPMPDIELRDLGTKEGGITPDQLVYAVMKSVTGSVIGATTKAAREVGATTGAAAADAVKKTGEGIKKLFGGK